MNKNFDAVFCINLNRRPDRWKESLKEFEKHNIIVERISAVDGETIKSRGEPNQKNKRIKPAEIGCSLSHLKALKTMIERGYEKILVLEDDVVFRDDISVFFNDNYHKIPDNWDMVLLCSSVIVKPLPVNDVIVKTMGAYSTAAYMITNSYAKTCIEKIEELHLRRAVDVVYSILQPDHNCYSFNPNIAWQRGGHSDIQGKYMDYSFLVP